MTKYKSRSTGIPPIHNWFYSILVIIGLLYLLNGCDRNSQSFKTDSKSQGSQQQNNLPNSNNSQAISNSDSLNELSSLIGHIDSTPLIVSSVVIGYNSVFYAGTEDGLYQSTDEGTSWKQVPIEVENGTIIKSSSFLKDAGSNHLILTCVGKDAVRHYLSNNGGQTWHNLNVPTIDLDNYVCSSGRTLYATSVGIYRTTNDGKTWSKVGLKDRIIRKLHMNNRGTLFADVSPEFDFSQLDDRNMYRSTDRGVTWKPLEIESVSSLVFTRNGNILAFDGGKSHILSSDEITGAHYLSSDNGRTWRKILDQNITSAWESVICTDGSILQVGWATVYSSFSPGKRWLLSISQNQGRAWTSTGISGIDESIGDCYLWTGADGYAVFIPPGPNNFFYLSSDNGLSWQRRTVR